jgi:3-oxoacyl-[acyl-carrier protein] reductase
VLRNFSSRSQVEGFYGVISRISIAMLLKDRIAFITGGSQGIGRACALVLAEAGADIAVGGRSMDKLDSVVQGVQALGRRALSISLDVTDPRQVKDAFAEFAKRFPRLDILVNNAGITKDALILRMKLEEWDSVLNTNLRGAFLCTQEAIKTMLRQRYGRIINISSVVGQTGNAGQANYVSSKAGLEGFTRSVAQEVASRNITVNAIAPGFIDTAMTQVLSESVRSNLLERIPLGRMGTDREIAYGVRFLASDEASYITGQVLHINGGLCM